MKHTYIIKPNKAIKRGNMSICTAIGNFCTRVETQLQCHDDHSYLRNSIAYSMEENCTLAGLEGGQREMVRHWPHQTTDETARVNQYMTNDPVQVKEYIQGYKKSELILGSAWIIAITVATVAAVIFPIALPIVIAAALGIFGTIGAGFHCSAAYQLHQLSAEEFAKHADKERVSLSKGNFLHFFKKDYGVHRFRLHDTLAE